MECRSIKREPIFDKTKLIIDIRQNTFYVTHNYYLQKKNLMH